ncbi:MAG: MFS transporter [Beutenbergiaceae bacterium]
MLSPYRQILALPGALPFSAAGALARLPMSMVTISIVLLVEARYESYTLAGQVAAAYMLAQAIVAPQLAKLVDSRGQALIMRPALLVAMVGLGGLAMAAAAAAPALWLFLTAGIGGASIGSMGALVRARWNQVVDSGRQLHTAYSLESSIDELVFVIGPVLATTLAASISPLSGLVIAVVAALLGGFWFLAQRSTEPPPAGRPAAHERGSVMRSAGMLIIAAVFVLMGTIFGSIDVSTVAFAEHQDGQVWAGPVLAVFAGGSLIAGLLYGAREFTMALPKRFVIGIVLLAVGTTSFLVVNSLPLLALAGFVTGFAIAPTIIAGNALVQQLVPGSRLTEGLTWVATAIGVGFAAGSSLTGAVVDAVDGHSGYLVAIGAATCAAVIAVATTGLMRRDVQRRRRTVSSTDLH